MRAPLVPILVAAGLALGVAACGDDKTTPSGTGAGQATTAPGTTAPASGGNASVGCKRRAEPAEPSEPDLKAPKDPLDPRKTYVIAFETTCGTFEVTLDVKRAPKTSASVASLTKRGFYDGLTFHRIGRQPDGSSFVIQGGDPQGTGNGGPGYTVVERPPVDLRYTKGVVAMAKTQLDDPGTSGSQFYVVTAADAGLPTDYALLGKVTSGADIVARIAKVETDPETEKPLNPVVIASAKLRTR